MSLPDLNLDDRKFQDIVDEAKRRIALRCPEWTEHNVSDPGVTLIELFSSMTESIIYRLNQVPEKNYRQFLELIGISLLPAEPARTMLRFNLVQPLSDRTPSGVPEPHVIPPYDTIVGVNRRDNEEPIEFELQERISLTKPGLLHCVSIPARQDEASTKGRPALPLNTLPLEDLSPSESPRTTTKGYPIFSKDAQKGEGAQLGDCLYLGFGANLSGFTLKLDFVCVTNAAEGLDRENPLHAWQVWTDMGWVGVRPLENTVKGFDASSGCVVLQMPPNAERREVAGVAAYWVRCRHGEDLTDPLRSNAPLKAYDRSPRILDVSASTVGGTGMASHSLTIVDEAVGQSDGLPGQVMKVRNTPTLAFRDEIEGVWTGLLGSDQDDRQRWSQVVDFSLSKPEDRHFTFDPLTGSVTFGPIITAPDGTTQQYGAIPGRGETVFVSYRVGGGTRGNVKAGILRVPRSALPFVESVTNPGPASGGRDIESLEHAKNRAKHVLKIRERAVTAEDYADLALEATGEKPGRAWCLQAIDRAGIKGVPPGTARVVLLPRISDSVLSPTPQELTPRRELVESVFRHLDERRLMTTVLEVVPARLRFVSVRLQIAVKAGYPEEGTKSAAEKALYRFLHPLQGGMDGRGWPFGRALTLHDIYSVVGIVPGVAYLHGAVDIYVSSYDLTSGSLSEEQRLEDLGKGVEIDPDEVICSHIHLVKAIPLSEITGSYS